VGIDGLRHYIEIYGATDLDALVSSGDAITPAEVTSWFAEAGSSARLRAPDQASPGMAELVRQLNLVRVSDDLLVAMTSPGEPAHVAEERLWRVKEAISVIRNDLPHLIEALMDIKGVRRRKAYRDEEIGPLVRLYEAGKAELPFMRLRLRDAAGYEIGRRAPWHDVAELIAARAKSIWERQSGRQLGVGKSTSPLVGFTVLALARARQGQYSPETVSKALTRRKGDKAKKRLGDPPTPSEA
jgi:hypothetical protein